MQRHGTPRTSPVLTDGPSRLNTGRGLASSSGSESGGQAAPGAPADAPAFAALAPQSEDPHAALKAAASLVFAEARRKGYKPVVLYAAIDTATKLALAVQLVDAKPTPQELSELLLNAAARSVEFASRTRADDVRESLKVVLMEAVASRSRAAASPKPDA